MKRNDAVNALMTLGYIFLVSSACRSSLPALTATERRTEPVVVPPPALPAPWPSPSPPPYGRRQLYITSRPDNAQVFLDGRYYGTTPLLLSDFVVGNYRLEIVKDGCERYASWIHYTEDQWAFFISLVPETGFLTLSLSPPEAVARTSTMTLASGFHELPAGSYIIAVSAFGYEPKTMAVEIRPHETTAAAVVLEKSPFAFSNLSLSRPVFNPRKTGPASSVVLHFSVSAPGRGSFTVLGADGRTMACLTDLIFTASEQAVEWNGRSDSGECVPDGTYALVLKGKGENDSVGAESSLYVAVDSTLSVEHGTMWSGSAGLVFVPTPFVLPAFDFSFNVTASAGYGAQDGLTAPAVLGARCGLGGGHEAAASLAAHFTAEGPPALLPTLSWKYLLFAQPGDFSLSAAFLAKAAYAFNAPGGIFTAASGLSAGAPFRFAFGPVAFYLEPELIFALYKEDGGVADASNPGAYAWLYGRAGFSFSIDFLFIGFSACLRSSPFDEGFSLAWPVVAAIEIAAVFPHSPFSLSAVATAEWTGDGLRLHGGLGFDCVW